MHLSSRRLRLASGLVLLAYLAGHLANHALGLFSIAAADAGRGVFLALWRSLPGTVLFYGALLLHFGLALRAVAERRSLRMPWDEALRIVLGFCVPPLLAAHFVATRLAFELQGSVDSYERIIAAMWASGAGAQQLLLVLMAWLHGCLGIHFAFRHRVDYQRWLPAVVVTATTLPLLAATGYLAMGREGTSAPSASAANGAAHPWLVPAADILTGLPLALLALVLVARGWRNTAARRAGHMVRITYPTKSVEMPLGASVLEASRAHGLPHLSLCGGRARCSTCRVRVDAEAEALPPPEADEARTLARIGSLPGVRLACQLRPRGPVTVEPLLTSRIPRDHADHFPGGEEQEVVVLFADLRRWTGLSEHQLPLDLVYLLDQYFEVVGEAVQEAGGVPNQFIGDSVMALFGVGKDAATGAREALAASAGIARRMATLNDVLQHQFGRRLEFGIGIHAGLAAVGSVGWRQTRTLTAVGDAVNTASRLQELTKTLRATLVVSQQVLALAGRSSEGWTVHDLAIRGRTGRLRVLAVSDIPGA